MLWILNVPRLRQNSRYTGRRKFEACVQARESNTQMTLEDE
jgi:hypothetical protein